MVKVQVYYSNDSFINGQVDLLNPHKFVITPYAENNNEYWAQYDFTFVRTLNLPVSHKGFSKFLETVFGFTSANSKIFLIILEIIRNGNLWTMFIDDVKEAAYYYYKHINSSRVNELASLCNEKNVDTFVKNASSRTWDNFYSKSLENYVSRNIHINPSNIKYIVGLAKLFREIFDIKDSFNMRNIKTNKLYAAIVLKKINHYVNPNMLLNGALEKIIKFAESSKNFDKDVIELIFDISSKFNNGSESGTPYNFIVSPPAQCMNPNYQISNDTLASNPYYVDDKNIPLAYSNIPIINSVNNVPVNNVPVNNVPVNNVPMTNMMSALPMTSPMASIPITNMMSNPPIASAMTSPMTQNYENAMYYNSCPNGACSLYPNTMMTNIPIM